MLQFQLTDIPRLLPEILLIVLALLILGSDIFERWGQDEASRRERVQSSASLAAVGLGLIFVIALVQSGYLFRLPDTAPVNFFTNIVRNLQSGGPNGGDILGTFATDHLTMISRLAIIGAAFITVLLAYTLPISGSPAEFYALVLFASAGMCMMAGANELIIAYLAIELTSIPLYILAGYFTSDRRSSEAGMKYFLFGALSSGILLYGMSLTYGFVANTLNASISANDLTRFPQIAAAAAEPGTAQGLLLLGLLFIIAGVGYKLAVVPFHAWAPDVYQGAPTPVTAFVSTASKLAGFVLFFRLLTVAFPGLTGTLTLPDWGGWASLLTLLAALTMIVGNLAALPQSNAKRLLAYSSVAHAGFVLMAMLAWATPLSIDRQIATTSLLYYLVVYTVTNLGAFGALYAIEQAVGGDDLRDMEGLAQRNLGLAVLFAICILSLAGIPPLAGFFAKFYVFMAAWQGGAQVLVVLAVIMTVISLYYYLRLLKAMFITAPASAEPVRTPPGIQASLLITTALLLLLGVYPNLVLPFFEQVQLALN